MGKSRRSKPNKLVMLRTEVVMITTTEKDSNNKPIERNEYDAIYKRSFTLPIRNDGLLIFIYFLYQ
ncbi:MAG: hypothetical protein QXD94_02350 [Sulfolobales archaeon]